jgi:hypothetical protein
MAKSGKALSCDKGRVNVAEQDNSTSANSEEDAKSSQGQKARNDFKMVEDMLALVHFHFEIPAYYLSPNFLTVISKQSKKRRDAKRKGIISAHGDRIERAHAEIKSFYEAREQKV